MVVRDVLREIININRKRIGPSTDPCGTPYEISQISDSVYPIRTGCVLLFR